MLPAFAEASAGGDVGCWMLVLLPNKFKLLRNNNGNFNFNNNINGFGGLQLTLLLLLLLLLLLKFRKNYKFP